MKLGAIAVAVILSYVLIVSPCLNDWSLTKRALAIERAKLDTVTNADTTSAAKQAGLLSAVPKIQMPQKTEIQGPLFRGKFNEQLKKAGIKVNTLKFLPSKKSRASGGYKTIRLECRGKCNFGQAMDLIAALKGNPYYVGIEELQLKCDAKKRNNMNIVLVVSSFVK